MRLFLRLILKKRLLTKKSDLAPAKVWLDYASSFLLPFLSSCPRLGWGWKSNMNKELELWQKIGDAAIANPVKFSFLLAWQWFRTYILKKER